jgi:hypothetical protein
VSYMNRDSLCIAPALAALLFGLCACANGASAGLANVTSANLGGYAAISPRSTGLLYAATLDWNTGTGSVYVYHAYGTKTSPIGSVAISPGFPDGLWSDDRGRIYVSVVNAGSNGRGYINVYTPGLTKLVRTYTSGVDGPSGGTFDNDGYMYVANLCGVSPSESCEVFAGRHERREPHATGASSGTSGYVAIYAPGATVPMRYLQTPINIAVDVAVDRSENVFVVNNTGSSAWNVIEFHQDSQAGKVVPFHNLPSQRWVGADTFDPQGALVISVNSAIDFFPRERGRTSRTLTDGVYTADGLAFGPDGSLFAGNYEFENNEGNVAVFLPRTHEPARTYSVPYGNGVVSITLGD